ncbi:MAG: bifunctional (p)ppGpp synthetase/guanosine-3',5'-bis(diphosphate) 3'-pyrophosphohydrolase [Planctomycetes bacterium]|nr:bifunctional (p)ppGpp synthetase/guanosine-3',5'-bis(diphosphate) 3'-pyrophosphohydrolase [Planctomycetota bacterium]
MNVLQQAIGLAARAHDGQLRKDGLPYIVHPMHVVSILIECDLLDQEILAAAALHDVFEDCDQVFVAELHAGFPARVVALVEELTHGEGSKLDAFRNMSPDAQTIKMADRLSNLTSMFRTSWSDEKRRHYAADGLEMSRHGSAACSIVSDRLNHFASSCLARLAPT